MRFSNLALVALAALACCAAPSAQGQEVVNIYQSGTDVDAVASGSLNLAGLSGSGPTNGPDAVYGQFAGVQVGSGSFDFYTGVTGPTSFGSGAQVNATSGSGDILGVQGIGGYLAVPTGYTSGPINGSAVFAGQTLSSLGLTPGTYVFTLPASTITVNIVAPAAVPEPGSIALLATSALTGAGFLARRRKNARQAA